MASRSASGICKSNTCTLSSVQKCCIKITQTGKQVSALHAWDTYSKTSNVYWGQGCRHFGVQSSLDVRSVLEQVEYGHVTNNVTSSRCYVLDPTESRVRHQNNEGGNTRNNAPC
jgi:hypothetical protein